MKLNWETGFQPRTTHSLQLPYEEYVYALDMAKDIGDCSSRLIRLPNNMIALCIQDMGAKQAAASLSVNIGSLADPPELQGLAHLLEHMLFMGSEKYPDKNEYKSYITDNFGFPNATTSSNKTNYNFQVDNSALEGALDRFSRFFIDPLLSTDRIEQELLVVDSEFNHYVHDNDHRSHAVFRATSNPNLPFSQFTTGNIQSLKKSAKKLGMDLRKELRAFFNTYYSADIMKLVVIGNHCLSQMAEWVVSMFPCVNSKGDTTIKLAGHPFSNNELGRVIRFESTGKKYKIRMVFPLPKFQLDSGSISTAFLYISTLLAHEGAGSLLPYLRHMGWATRIFAYRNNCDADGFGVYFVEVDATPLGTKHYKDMSISVLTYLRVLSQVEPHDWFIKEVIEHQSAIDASQVRSSGVNLAQKLANTGHTLLNPINNMPHCKADIDFKGQFAFKEITQVLGYLSPENYCLYVETAASTYFEYTHMVEHYNVKYEVDGLSNYMTSLFDISKSPLAIKFSMPQPNPYTFTLNSHNADDKCSSAPAATTEPTMVKGNDSLELWFMSNTQVTNRSGVTVIKLMLQDTQISPLTGIMFRALCSYANIELNEIMFHASRAGLQFLVEHNHTSIEIKVAGHIALQSILIGDIVKTLKTITIKEPQLDQVLAQLKYEFCNSAYSNPLRQAANTLDHMNITPSWQHAELECKLNQVTPEGMQFLANHIFTKMYTKVLVVGNLHQADALQVANIVQAGFTSAPLHNPTSYSRRAANIGQGHYICQIPLVDKNCKDSALIHSVYCEQYDDTRGYVAGNLLIKILSEPFFDQIRNKEQLGYAVNLSSVRFVNGRRIIKFSVQGKNSPAYMALRVDRFIYNARQTLHDYSSKKLARLVESIVSMECEKAENPAKQVDAIWNKISSGSYKFGQKNDIIKHLKNVTKDDLLMFWDRHISPKLAPAYTCVDYYALSAAVPRPTKLDMHLYPAEIIALHSCLYNLGATSISANRLCAAVNLAAKHCNSADILMGRLEKFLDDKPFLNFTPVLKTQLKAALVLYLAK